MGDCKGCDCGEVGKCFEECVLEIEGSWFDDKYYEMVVNFGDIGMCFVFEKGLMVVREEVDCWYRCYEWGCMVLFWRFWL